ncbi:hypothetical protein VO01_13680 [Clavibacter michiganensis subsp. insidiosus]|uniref:Uncharacterized protein n=1 Tax=Clavibacter michiganensis subsp. insidiosus TaxID=33014 RepID=A0A0D5CK56_9MICO|nr:hypothetical protein VO01_13680 [Clavibacter michiganensis subsp. insidiosus]
MLRSADMPAAAASPARHPARLRRASAALRADPRPAAATRVVSDGRPATRRSAPAARAVPCCRASREHRPRHEPEPP